MRLRALGATLYGSCRTDERAPQPRYGQRLTACCVRDTTLPFYTEQMTEICFRDAGGRRVQSDFLGEIRPSDGAELQPKEGYLAVTGRRAMWPQAEWAPCVRR